MWMQVGLFLCLVALDGSAVDPIGSRRFWGGSKCD